MFKCSDLLPLICNTLCHHIVCLVLYIYHDSVIPRLRRIAVSNIACRIISEYGCSAIYSPVESILQFACSARCIRR